MIKTEIREINGVQYRYTYSTENRYVVRSNGALYEEVYDPINIIREYTEGEPILTEEPTETEFAEVGRVLLDYEHN